MSGDGPKVYQVVIDRRTGRPVQFLGEVIDPEKLFTLPPEDTVLWRYSDYCWIRQVITDGTLYFRRGDLFKDTLEGTFTAGNKVTPSTMFAEAAGKLPMDRIRAIQETHRAHAFVNCWHKNPNENPRMWKEYPSGPESIAIRTDAISLCQAVPLPIFKANVHYVEEGYSIPEFHSLAPLVHKRRDPYEFEQEFRLIYQLPLEKIARADDKADEGRTIPVDARQLVHLIRFHPKATEAFKAAVQADLATAKLDIKTEPSAFA